MVISTYRATIYCGLRNDVTYYFGVEEVIKICREFTKAMYIGVTVTGTNFVYRGKVEPGVIVELVNCPRFPIAELDIKKLALELAVILKKKFEQDHVIVVCTDETINV